ncbi:MAG: hypothetical protein V1722_03135 [Candidatus Micrarchaeota archaeon]
MEKVAKALANAFNGYSVDVEETVREHSAHFHINKQPETLHGAVGLEATKRTHDPFAIALLVKPTDFFHETRQEQLKERLARLSDLLRKNKLTLVYQIPQGDNKTAAISIHRYGVLGWLGRRAKFVNKLRELTRR